MIPSVLSSQLIQGAKDFLTTTFHSTTPTFFGSMEKFVNGEGKLFKGPYVSVALPFRKGDSKEKFFPHILDTSFSPYYHQELAFKRLSGVAPKPTLLATGTGSGKTESFMYPILDYCLQNRDKNGIKAIIIYPMNALATDQAKRFAKTIAGSENLQGLRVGLFVGDKEENPKVSMSADYVITDKDTLRRNPPEILLTNYKMLDFLLMRPKDQEIWKNNIDRDVLKYLAVDEIHTFDGAQGTDLASLLRRLRAKLGIKKDSLACVGTSATLGNGGTQAIREFATTVFNEKFDEDSVVTEYRITADEFFENIENDFFNFPDAKELEALEYKNYKTIEKYIQAQYKLWLYDDIEDVKDVDFRIKLGEKLKELSLFKQLLKTLDGKVTDQNKIVEQIKRRINPGNVNDSYFIALINSLLALTSWAKGKKLGEYAPPFLHVRVQLWLRELTRMVGSLSKEPQIKFSHDLSIKENIKHYPIVHCRECHAMGWGGVKKEGESELKSDLDLFYQTFFAHDPRLKFIFPVDDKFKTNDGRVYEIDPFSGQESDEESAITVYEPYNLTKNHKSHNDCPFCSSKNSLTILGSRAASLTSVLIGQSYASSFNDDKKLITFSDSVQDAAHRAGFFGARSYQFALRSALQQALMIYGKDISILEFGTLLKDFWKTKLISKEQYVATMIAPDMEWLQDYDELQQTGKLPLYDDPKKEITHLIDQRLDWSIFSEYGYKSNIGRTLERSTASVAYVEGFENIVNELLPKIQNDYEMLRSITSKQLEQFIFGFLVHLKKNGAIFNSHLETYVGSGGNIFAFTPYQKIYMPAFTKRSKSPEFLTSGNFPQLEKIHTTSNSSWCDGWLLDNFLDENLLVAGYKVSIYRDLINTLINHKILIERESTGHPIWGLNPQNIKLTTSTIKLECDNCGDNLVLHQNQLDLATDMCCLRKTCQGHYEQSQIKDDFYKDLYSYGDLQRIVAEEHTGLLAREKREWVEKSFIGKKENEPWKPNLLSATPTLEMGIDIGDLSSVILCSVPPNGANYLQRVGRAGRTDGNSFNATLANGNDHDLYFYSDPNEMMQGSIDAPGVFIDASAILQRQFVAFCIDQWVSSEKIKEADLPYKLSKVLEAVDTKDQNKFPFTLINFIHQNTANLLKLFFELYEGSLQDKTKEQLGTFANGKDEDVRNQDEPDELKESISLSYKLLNRLEQVILEKKAIQLKIEQVRKKIKAHQKSEARDKDHEDKLKEYESELSGLKSVLRVINKRDTFEFFTNEGLLPNYAFPESGVVLKSVIFRQKQKVQGEDGAGYDSFTFEYERAGSSAISELAPNNSFYASGRKVTVDQIDMNVSEVETWRFCDQCSYSVRESTVIENECPKCGSHMWADAGQKREILRLKQVMANTSDRSSRLKDDSEQRDPTFYTKQLLINFEKEHIQDAYAIESDDTPFGFEFIQKVKFKEINFGENTLAAEEVSIAGKRMPRRGFVICRHCGKVQERGLQDAKFKAKHAFSCEAEDPSALENFVESLYLYREFNSEAIRLLLPITTMAISDEKLHSLISAFQMGLKLYFKGSVDHLRVSIHDEVERDENYKRRYLVLYDTVPGGTGYLRQLMRDSSPLFEVLKFAYEKLSSCSCNDDHTLDGCYRCIYAYKNNFDRPLISRESAKEIIKAILKYQDSIKKVDTLSNVSANGLFDSELEERFLTEVSNHPKIKLKQTITSKNHTGYLIEVNNKSYEILQQVELGEKDGIAVSCRADFVFYPLRSNDIKPIVVFTDGFTYHKDRLGIDSAQRMALKNSGKFIVWSLTWEDVYQYAQKHKEYQYVNFLDDPHTNLLMYNHLSNDKSFMSKSSLEWFFELLEESDLDKWKKRAQNTLIAMLGKKQLSSDHNNWSEILTEDMSDSFISLSDQFLCEQNYLDEIKILSLGILDEIKQKNFANAIGAVQIDDTKEVSMGKWAGVLRLYNLFQFLQYGFFTSKQGLKVNRYENIIFSNKEVQNESKEEWKLIYEDVLDEAKKLVKDLSQLDISLPEVGYEICNKKGVVIAETELAWSDYKIAIMIDEKTEIENWNVFLVDEIDLIIDEIKSRSNK